MLYILELCVAASIKFWSEGKHLVCISEQVIW